MIKRITDIIAAKALALLTLTALLLLAGGLAVKYDPSIAAIVTGLILLADIELSSLASRGQK